MKKVARRAALVVVGASLAAGAVAPMAGATPKAEEASLGWRITKTFGCGQGNVVAITSTGADGAWATGEWTPCTPDATARILLARWNGHTWQEPPIPSDVVDSLGNNAIAALSDSYSWTFGRDEDDNGLAFLYLDGRWRTYQLPGQPLISSAVVFSKSNAWAFGMSESGGDPYAARFNGHSWRQVGIPMPPVAIAAPAPGNIWAIGWGGSQAGWELAHWTDRWQVVPLPDLPSGTGILGVSLVSDGAKGAWVAVGLQSTGTAGDSGLLLQWTGRRWNTVTVPFPAYGFGPLAHDGHGGLWIAEGSCASCYYTDMLHYRPGHGWSKPIPAGWLTIDAMRFIPRTGSVWAAGVKHFGPHNYRGRAVLLKYGP